MSYFYLGSEMGTLRWPTAHGVAVAGRANAGHTLSEEERGRLDALLGIALVDADIRQRLLSDRDDSLLTAYALSDETLSWLRGVRASSLTELAQAIAYHS